MKTDNVSEETKSTITADTVIVETVSANRHSIVVVCKPEKPTSPSADHVLFLWIGSSLNTICLTGLASYRAFVQCMKSACVTVECADSAPRKVRGVTVEAIDDGHIHSMGEVAIEVRHAKEEAACTAYTFTVSAPQPCRDATKLPASFNLAPVAIGAAEAAALGELFVKVGKNRCKAVMTTTSEEWFVPPFFKSSLEEGHMPAADCLRQTVAHIRLYSPAHLEDWVGYLWQLRDTGADFTVHDGGPRPTKFEPWLGSPPFRPWDDYEVEVDGFRQFGKDFAAEWLTERRVPNKGELIDALVNTHRFLPVELATRTAEHIAETALRKAAQCGAVHR